MRTADDITPILEQRAAALAGSSKEKETRAETVAMVVLVVGDERYGVDVRDIREIEPLDRVTPIPGTHAFWSGIVNLRGSLYPVLDLERYLGLPESAPVEQPKVALVSRGGLSVGLLADDVTEIREVDVAEVGPPLIEAQHRAGVVRGVTPDFLSILDLEALLADPALVADDDAA